MFGAIPDFTKQMTTLVDATEGAVPPESLPRPSLLYNDLSNYHLAQNQKRKHSTLPPNLSSNTFLYDRDTHRPTQNRIPDKDAIQVASSSQDNLNDLKLQTADTCDSRNKDEQGMLHLFQLFNCFHCCHYYCCFHHKQFFI